MNNAPVKILLVEDDEDDYLIIQDYLADTFLKYEIKWVNNFSRFQEQLPAGRFDVVITDYMLGSTSGLEVLRTVKEKEPLLPVIIFTGKGSNSLDIEAMKLGASDYLIKGNFTADMVERSMRYALERAHAAKVMIENETYENTLDKIVSTARVARMIAHEVRNPLTTITLCADQM